jgi:hypothetical protein
MIMAKKKTKKADVEITIQKGVVGVKINKDGLIVKVIDWDVQDEHRPNTYHIGTGVRSLHNYILSA